MNFAAFFALARRDLRLFFMDRRAVIMSFVAPILIGSFFGYLFGGVSDREPSKIGVSVVDQDGGAISKRVFAALAADKSLETKPADLEKAREAVRTGKSAIAVVVPAGFSDRAATAFFRGENRPEVQLLYDPSHATELAMVRGILTQHVMEAVSGEMFSGPTSQKYVDDSLRDVQASSGMKPEDRKALVDLLQGVRSWSQRPQAGGASAGGRGRGGLSMPYTTKEEAVTARKGVQYNSMAHSFAGMSVQFILFMGIDAGMIVLVQRRNGLWRRLQAAPISRFTVIASRVASATAISMIILAVVFGFARLVFHVKIEGSLAGFVGVCAAFSLMTAAFGLLIAMLGNTPEGTRGISILVTLLLVMLGGSWVPAFLFPQWLQKATFAVPTRWAVDGLDATLWRGFELSAVLPHIGALLAFAALFGAVAVWRFKWQTEG
jgi:ABC-2 type transport system permease protein